MIMKKNIISITVLLLSFILITLTANADGNTSIITQIANMTFKVLIEDKKEHIFDYKTPLKLAEGYELHVTSLDSDGVHLLLTKDWDKVDRKVIATFAGKTYFYNKLIGNLTNVTIIEVRLKSAAISNEDYSVTVDRIRQISEKPVLNPAEIASIEEKEKEERERPKTHQYSAGAPGVNEFVLNWTDKNKYSDIVCDLPFDFHEDGISTITTHYQIRAKNETDSNTTLMFVINWHPGAKRPAEATLTTFPAKLHTEAITSQSDIMIQGKSGMMFAYKEQRDYQGSNAPPLITPPFYSAKYFLDDYTEVTVSGNMVYWSSKDFKAMLSTLRITPPAGYY